MKLSLRLIKLFMILLALAAANSSFSQNNLSSADDQAHLARFLNLPVLLPPTNLEASVNSPDVHLTWSGPSGPSLEELIYDNNTTTGAYSYVGYTMSSRMSPIGPCKILKLKYYTTFANPAKTGFKPKVFNWTGTAPGTNILLDTTANAVDNDWVEVDISAANVNVTGDFMVGFGSIEDSVYMGYNTTNNGRAWDHDDGAGTWAQWNETYFIRAVVEYSKGNIVELAPVNASPNALTTPIPFANRMAHPHNTGIANPQIPVNNMSKPALQGFNVYRNAVKLNTTVLPDLFYDDLALAPGTYNYTVTAVYTAGESNPTPALPVTVGGVSVGEHKQTGITIYPNPTSEIVNVRSDATIKTIELLSYSGQILLSKPLVNALHASINVSGLASGVYFIKVISPEDTHISKLTVTH